MDEEMPVLGTICVGNRVYNMASREIDTGLHQ